MSILDVYRQPKKLAVYILDILSIWLHLVWTLLSISERTVKVDISLPVWFAGNRYSVEVDLIRTWCCIDTWIVPTMLISDWDILPQEHNMKPSKLFILESKVRTATTRALVQEQTIDWNLFFVCTIDESKSVQLTKPSARKGKGRQYHHAFPYLPSETTVTPNKL